MSVISLSLLRLKGFVSKGTVYIVLVGFACIMGASLLGGVVIGEEDKVLKDLGVKIMSFFAVVMCVFMGAGEWSRERHERTVYALLSKPVSRMQWVASRALGIFFRVSLQVWLLGIFLWFVLLFSGTGGNFPVLKILLLIMGEILLVSAIITFFTTFTTPYLCGLFALSICITGLFLNDMYLFGEKVGGAAVKKLSFLLYYLFPDLSVFQMSGRIAYGMGISWHDIGLTLLYGTSYSLFLLMLAACLFQKRDL